MKKTDYAKDIVIFQHCDAFSYQYDDLEAIEVWHCYILGNEKWMFAISERGSLADSYYEVTYNKNKDEFYVDHYVKESTNRYDNE